MGLSSVSLFFFLRQIQHRSEIRGLGFAFAFTVCHSSVWSSASTAFGVAQVPPSEAPSFANFKIAPEMVPNMENTT